MIVLFLALRRRLALSLAHEAHQRRLVLAQDDRNALWGRLRVELGHAPPLRPIATDGAGRGVLGVGRSAVPRSHHAHRGGVRPRVLGHGDRLGSSPETAARLADLRVRLRQSWFVATDGSFFIVVLDRGMSWSCRLKFCGLSRSRACASGL